ncbi:hypothetical protein K504DRAFT_512570 [Pleomassaria siparia CBS 279.74]|uniref:Uncharacterized protein n=1 Tax=Pleomassaria siparia CBS 279.74 TaxID=1314801 RepID=A0A6G1K506_9PLEO|nr:hypothetical protein K504DRAFT_512570 [Pleomassaria siparia CBS 279.74]
MNGVADELGSAGRDVRYISNDMLCCSQVLRLVHTSLEDGKNTIDSTIIQSFVNNLLQLIEQCNTLYDETNGLMTLGPPMRRRDVNGNEPPHTGTPFPGEHKLPNGFSWKPNGEASNVKRKSATNATDVSEDRSPSPKTERTRKPYTFTFQPDQSYQKSPPQPQQPEADYFQPTRSDSSPSPVHY